MIKGFVTGEEFIFNNKSTEILKDYPGLSNDPDFNKGNPGITIIFL